MYEGMSVVIMGSVRLIKRQGARLSLSDRAYVLFNSYSRGSVMGAGYMPKCGKCCGRFSLNDVSVYRWERFSGPVILGYPSVCEGGFLNLCYDCVVLMRSEGYVLTWVKKVASCKGFFIK